MCLILRAAFGNKNKHKPSAGAIEVGGCVSKFTSQFKPPTYTD